MKKNGAMGGCSVSEVVPPRGIALQMLYEPRADSFYPILPFLIIVDDVVLAVHLNVRHFASQNLQCRKELLAFVGGDIGVLRAVKEEQRRVYFVGVEKWGMKKLAYQINLGELSYVLDTISLRTFVLWIGFMHYLK